MFESILIDVGGRPSLFKMGKLGILWQLDRMTGKFIRATDLGYQNILDVDPQTGKVTYLPGMIPKIGVEMDFCPSTAGFKSWRAMAFSPQTNALYIPMNLNCENATFGPAEKVVRRRRHGTGARARTQASGVGRQSRRVPRDRRRTGKILWRQRTPSPIEHGGARDGRRRRVRRRLGSPHVSPTTRATARSLWQTRLPTSAQGFPITYLAKGKQYVAMPAGIGGGSWSTLIPPELAPEIRRPNSGNALARIRAARRIALSCHAASLAARCSLSR